ncbi:MAG TPA: NAD kinase [Paludibacter sp.]|nr:NAD kinase [Paludibacter sp.]
MRIAVFGNIYRTVIISHIKVMCDFFRNKDAVILLEKKLYDFVREHDEVCLGNTEIIEDDNFDADMVFSIGGDGTFLNTAAHIGRKQIPVLGINTGRLGFLSDISSEDILLALESIENKQYTIEERSLIQLEIGDGNELEHPYALNEVSVQKQDSSSMISINVSINGHMVHTYQADGLVVSTPTGSTAYSMSVGGPIVVPQAQNFILSPVASHSLTVRPLIVPDSWTIELEVFSRSGSFLMALDGRSKVLEQKTKLCISKADFPVRIVKLKNHTFFNTLKNKLLWGVDKRNG